MNTKYKHNADLPPNSEPESNLNLNPDTTTALWGMWLQSSCVVRVPKSIS